MNKFFKCFGLVKKLFTIIVCLSICNHIQSQPAGYYNNAASKSCATLKTALKTIITNGHNPRSYAALWNQYPISDIKPRTVGAGSTNVISDVYSAVPGGTDPYQYIPGTNQCGTYNGEGVCYNREHSIPLSWFDGNTGSSGTATDYIHIYPTDGHVNGKRASFIYGEVANANFTSQNGSKLGSSAIAGFTGNVFEPIDSFKGDLARSFLYFITRYEDDMTTFATNVDAAQSFDGNTFPSVKINYLKLMLKWHRLDPVSSKEKSRNNAAYTYQGNRNPYIDHPEYVDSVWNGGCAGLGLLPVNIINFAGKMKDNNIVLVWEVGSEINLKQYEIERSFNGTAYTKIATQEAKYAYQYLYNDNVEEIRGRRVYYRIKKVDKDGSYSYSEIFTIHIPLNTKFVVYPNPAKNNFTIRLNSNTNKALLVQITDIAGKILLSKNMMAVNGGININTNGLNNGNYFVKVTINDEVLAAKLVVGQ